MYLCRLGGKCPERTEKLLIRVLQIVVLSAIVFGAVKEANLVWTMGDIGIGIMAWVNVISIILLSPKAFKALKEYEASVRKK